jgi:vacuolar-type H+-ATPase subunit I/STV1
MITLQVAAGVLLGFFLINRYIRDSSPFKAFFAELFWGFAIFGSLFTIIYTTTTAYSLLEVFENLWFVARLSLALMAGFLCLGIFVMLCYLIYLTIIRIEKNFENL